MIKAIPHAITSMNLLCGVLAIVALADGRYIDATYLVFAAGILDFFDGFAARLLKVSGEFGKQLDSLADVVTFGVVPGLMIFYLSADLGNWPFSKDSLPFVRYTALLIPIFSALRLAKFNIDTNQSNSFIGVPTPANAFWIASLPYLLRDYPELLSHSWVNPYSFAALSVLSSALLVSPIPLFSLKLKSYAPQVAWPQYVFLLVMLISLILFKFAALFGLVPIYLILSLIVNRKK